MNDFLTLAVQAAAPVVTDGGGGAAFLGISFGLVLLLLLAQLVIWIVAMIKIVTSDFSLMYKVVWGAVIFFFPCVGLIAWLVLGKKDLV